MRPKRFARASYARRARALADDLDEWAGWYQCQLEDTRPNGRNRLQLARLGDRVGQLRERAEELEFIALRIEALS